MGGGKGMSVLRLVTGMGSAGSLALALLAGGCVLAATLGPREAQATGARAAADDERAAAARQDHRRLKQLE